MRWHLRSRTAEWAAAWQALLSMPSWMMSLSRANVKKLAMLECLSKLRTCVKALQV